jgi:hypothetical protein
MTASRSQKKVPNLWRSSLRKTPHQGDGAGLGFVCLGPAPLGEGRTARKRSTPGR